MNSCMVSNYIERNGFVMVSNLLIAYQKELNLTNKELLFITKAKKHKSNYKLHDSILDPTVSERTLARYRKSLSDKGYLTFRIWKYRDEQGHLHTEGITYDFIGLEKKLQALSDRIEEGKIAQMEKEAEDYILEYGEDSPIIKFMDDWEAHYGDKYVISPVEKRWYNSLTKEDQEYVGRVFEFCENNNLFSQIVPRLALFAKVNSRFVQLKNYCENTPVYECINGMYDTVIEEDDSEAVKAMKAEKIKKEELEDEKNALIRKRDKLLKEVKEYEVKQSFEKEFSEKYIVYEMHIEDLLQMVSDTNDSIETIEEKLNEF